MTDDMKIEKQIQEKGLNAPRLTPDQIDSVIEKKQFHVFDNILTICVLTLKNGFYCTGESACVSPENFDKVIGEEIAFRNAREKIWSLEGYLIKQALHEVKALTS